MPDYQNGKVYKMVAGGMTYVGSTTRTLAQRKASHRANWKRWKAGKGHKVTSFDLFECEEEPVDIVLLEDVPCERKEQLHARERHWIEALDCVNRNVPGRTVEEVKVKKRDYMRKRREAKEAEYTKEERDAARQKMRERVEKFKEWYKLNKDQFLAGRDQEVEI